MKKLSIIAVNVFVAASLLLTSCGNKDEKKGATINFVSGEGLVTKEATVSPNGTFTFGITATKGDGKMKTLSVTRDGKNEDLSVVKIVGLDSKTDLTVNPIELKGDNDNVITATNFTIVAENNPGIYTYAVNIVDANSITTTVSVKITVSSAKIDTFTAKLLGAQSASAGSYLTYGGEVILQSNTASNASLIVLSFAQVGTPTTVSKLISPLTADRVAESLTKGVDGGLTTYFKESSLDFSTVTTAQLDALTASSAKSIAISAGKVYEFVSGKKKGLVKVVSVVKATDSSTDGSVTLDVKVLN